MLANIVRESNCHGQVGRLSFTARPCRFSDVARMKRSAIRVISALRLSRISLRYIQATWLNADTLRCLEIAGIVNTREAIGRVMQASKQDKTFLNNYIYNITVYAVF